MEHTPVVKKQTCLYCGNNPVSHERAQLDSLLNMVLMPLTNTAARLPGGKLILSFSEHVLDRAFELLVLVGVVKFGPEADLVKNDRGKVLYDEAYARGWKMETAIIVGKVMDMYRLSLPTGKTLIFNGLPRLDAQDNALASWIDDKAELKRRLLDAGVRASRGKGFRSLRDAEAYFTQLPYPVITKPRFGSRGRHTTTYISELEDFRMAFKRAKQLCVDVVVEEHLEGSVYRATMIDGKLAGVLAGDPPRVTGDGAHTICELIDIKNNTRHERVGAYKITDITPIFLKRFGYTLETVLEKGKTIDLSEKIGLSYGGNAREVTKETHPKLREALEHAARVVDDPIIGFDFITPDVSADPDTVRWGIIECNAVPFINLHHDPLEGEPVNVAGIFLDYIERNI